MWAGFLYLAVATRSADGFERRSMATTLHTQVVLLTGSMALGQRRSGVIHHFGITKARTATIVFGKRYSLMVGDANHNGDGGEFLRHARMWSCSIGAHSETG